ncbi:hypothetical protein BIY29_05605 [Brenneria alni]|uniref:Uncharacterized protein n=1 Tax=Brenneria alni TaxID=71656 RepID=A0A421DR98_9GAMM|nr:hypothetical protein BIY29_05605 [Brenneria alni]
MGEKKAHRSELDFILFSKRRGEWYCFRAFSAVRLLSIQRSDQDHCRHWACQNAIFCGEQGDQALVYSEQ